MQSTCSTNSAVTGDRGWNVVKWFVQACISQAASGKAPQLTSVLESI